MSAHAKVLAMMLALQPPGASAYSRMVVEQDTPPPCAEKFSPLCFPPKWDERRKAWTVAETSDMGRIRYKTIAKAVTLETWRVPPSRRGKVRRMVIASMYGESGFREDIHAGIGKHSRGDCKSGRCKSHCLGQIMIPKHGGTVPRIKWKYRAKDLVGTDLNSTRRCTRATVEMFEQPWKRCGGEPGCLFTIYLGAKSRKHPRVQSRIRVFYKLMGMKL